jgi:hypothetical protein
MDIKHITSDTLRSLLGLTDKKDQLIKAVAGVEDELAKALKSITTTALHAVESVSPGKSTKPAKKKRKMSRKTSARKSVKSKRTMSAEGRARISAATKARWAARRAAKA